MPDGSPCTASGATLTCPAGSLAVGERLAVEVTGTVPRDGGGRPVGVGAAAGASEADPHAGDDDGVEQVDAVTVADLSATARAPQGMVEAGRTASYALIAHNDGPSDGTGVVVRSPLPAEADVVRLDPRCRLEHRVVTCQHPTLAPGENAEFEIVVKARVRFDARRLADAVSVEGSSPDPEGSNDGKRQAPPARTCTSRRNFDIRLRLPRVTRPGAVTAHVAGRRVPVVQRGRLRVIVDLRGMPKGRVVVDLRVRTADGIRTGRRAYHLCESVKRPGGRIEI
jgi:hypothetical protein